VRPAGPVPVGPTRAAPYADPPVVARSVPAAPTMADYDYVLPPGAVAQSAVEPRDAARLLVATDPGGTVAHGRVSDLPGLLEPGDLLVVNDTRVVPARLRLFKATGGRAEVLLLEPTGPTPDHWEALVRPARRLPPGTVLASADGVEVLEVGGATGRDTWVVRLLADPAPFGSLPLPPYLRSPLADPARYQTVYAERPGSVAAPTAGLHLTAGPGARGPPSGRGSARSARAAEPRRGRRWP